MVAVPDVPEVDLTDPEVVRDPHTAYGRARERAPLARVVAPGVGTIWTVTRHGDTRTMLADPRFEMTEQSFLRPADVPADCLPYLRTMAERDGGEHARLRRLVAPAFTARRAAGFRPRIEPIVARLLDELPEGGPVDLLRGFAWRLPIEVICELVGIPPADRPRWRGYAATVAAGAGPAFAAAIPDFLADARSAVASARADGDGVLGLLARASAEDGDSLSEVELVTLVWHLVLAGQTPANLIANAVAALFAHPEQLAVLRSAGRPADMTRAVEELTRWCGPTMLAIPRYARTDVELHGVVVRRGEPVSAAVVAANRDPRVFADPDRLDLTRDPRAAPHLGFGHGPHFCLGAAVARTQVEVALTMLFERFPRLALAVPPADVDRVPDPGTWRLASLPVVLGT